MELNFAALDSLQKHRGHVASVIAGVLSVKKGREKLSEQVKTVLERFGRDIDSIVLCEGKKRTGFVRFHMNDEDMTEIQEIFDKVGRLITIFVLEITLAGHPTLAELSESIKGTQCTENDMLRSVENNAVVWCSETPRVSDLLLKAYNIKSLPRVGAAYDDNHALNQKRTVSSWYQDSSPRGNWPLGSRPRRSSHLPTYWPCRIRKINRTSRRSSHPGGVVLLLKR